MKLHVTVKLHWINIYNLHYGVYARDVHWKIVVSLAWISVFFFENQDTRLEHYQHLGILLFGNDSFCKRYGDLVIWWSGDLILNIWDNCCQITELLNKWNYTSLFNLWRLNSWPDEVLINSLSFINKWSSYKHL